jgi:hypothetical protein
MMLCFSVLVSESEGRSKKVKEEVLFGKIENIASGIHHGWVWVFYFL